MIFEDLSIPGAFLIRQKRFSDDRGVFVKTFHEGLFREAGIDVEFRESFYSTSHRNVLRGMHFQLPPQDHEKLVFCMHGKVLDVFLDLRKASPTFGKAASVELSGAEPSAVFLPKGIAHGFLSLEDDSLMYYKVSTVHSPVHDAGILWNSFGFDWGIEAPILSVRDRGFAAFDPEASGF